MSTLLVRKNAHPADFPGGIPDNDWSIYEAVMSRASSAGIRFALGGAFGLATYTGRWRNTKDLDLIILPRDRESMIAVVSRLGLTDYWDERPYDRQWIYRSTIDGVIVDLIWAMANRRAEVDEWWLSGPEVRIQGTTVKVVPPEAILWDKLYIMQRERCDWPDIMNLLYATGPYLDWSEVVERLGPDMGLLTGALSVFSWLSPGIAARLPGWLWERAGLPVPRGGRLPKVNRRHAALLDSRSWYATDVEKRRTA